MIHLRSLRKIALAATLAVAVAGPDAAANDLPSVSHPVVVELFTSQGCSSCPPADALLGELADDPSVIALSLHVDYWDYIGWKDPYASPKMTARQRSYAQQLRQRFVYTPQMVIDGREELVGSRRGEVLAAVSRAGETPKPLALEFESQGGDRVLIPAGEAPEEGATVWLAVYDAGHETDIRSGENAGQQLRYSNVVRSLTNVGTWTGEAMEIALDLSAAAADGRDGCAIIVQQGGTGPVLGAIKMLVNTQ